MKAIRSFSVFILLLTTLGFQASATHLAGGEFSWVHVSGDSFTITLNLYEDCSGAITIGDGDRVVRLRNDCGVDTTVSFVKSNPGGTEVSQLCPAEIANSECNGGALPGMLKHTYEITMELDTCDTWAFSHAIANRNSSINGVNTDADRFYVDATFNSATDSTNNAPTFTNDPIPYICVNQQITYNFGVTDVDGDSVVFSLVAAQDWTGCGGNTTACQQGGAKQDITYQTGLSGSNPVTGITLDAATGEMIFTPTSTGNLIIAVQVDEYDSFTGDYLGYVIRDMQVVVENCLNTNPAPPDTLISYVGTAIQTDSLEITANPPFGINPGDSFCVDFQFIDPDGDSLTISSNSSTVLPGSSFSVNYVSQDTVTATLCWTATTGMPTNNTVVVTANDSACPVSATNSVALSVIVPQTPQLLVAISTVDITCNGEVDGEAYLNVSGSGSYNIVWAPCNAPCSGQGTDTVTNLAAGAYSVFIQDLNLLQDTNILFVIDEPFPIIASATIGSEASCADSCDASINMLALGGVGTLTALWSDGSTDLNNSDLCGGTYTVTITDGNGCTATATSTIVEPPPLVARIDSTDSANCNGSADGVAYASAFGGSAASSNTNTYEIDTTGSFRPYGTGIGTAMVLANDAMSNAQSIGFSFEFFGTAYTDFYISSNGFITFSSGQNNAPNPETIPSATTTDNLIAAAWTDLDPSQGGTIEYYTAGSSPNRILVVNYVSVPHQSGTDSVTSQIVLFETSNIIQIFTTAKPNGGNATMGIENQLGTEAYFLAGRNNAAYAVTNEFLTFVPPQSGYTIAWPSGGSSLTESNLAAGTYCVTITDGNGCSDTACAIIAEPAAIALTLTENNAISCPGDSDGEAMVSATGGTGTITFEWSDTQTGNLATGLSAGTYTVTATDANGCTAVDSITLVDPSAMNTTTFVASIILCNGDSNGSVGVSVTGGTAPYAYLWDDPSASTNDTAMNVPTGTWHVTVTDDSGCTAVDSIEITEPAVLTVTASGTDPLCAGETTGSASAVAAGGTTNYSFEWSDGQTGSSATTLAAGTYTVTVTDANGCTATDQVTLTDPAAITLSLAVTNDLECNGDSDGEITATTGGGAGGFTFDWSDGSTANPITGLTAGTYTVTVTDANGCTAVETQVLTEPTAIGLSLAQTANISCVGAADGEITASTTGGTGLVTFEWSTGSTANPLSGLTAGTYTVTATDANNCTEVESLTISDPAGINTTTTVISDVSCFGDSDGEAAVSVTGGTAPYTFLWNDAGNTTNDTLSNVVAGTYTVTVTDANGCTAVDDATITEPTLLTVTASGTDPLCAGETTGSASAVAAGGTTNYTFEWSDGQTGTPATTLAAGTYTVTVTDANGCTATDQVTLTDPAAITLSLAVTNDLECNGDSDGEITATTGGGAGGFTFDWSDGSTANPITGLTAGTYTVTVTDANGCTAVETQVLTEPTAIGLSLAQTANISCVGAADGEITASTTGGTGLVTFEWSTGSTANPLSGLTAGTYTVTATDANNCTEVESLTISDPVAVTANATIINSVTCNGFADGSGTVAVSGGTAPYTLLWNDPANSTTDTITGLDIGTYTVTATDANGCTGVDSITITQPAALNTLVFVFANVTCNGDSTGGATAAGSGGTSPYSYLWSNGDTNNFINAVPAGTYTVTITDANGCTDAGSGTITQPTAISLSTVVNNNVACNGDSTGSATVTATDGTPGYTYLWSTGSTSDTPNDLPAGTFTVTVTDAAGCTALDSVTITEPSAIGLTLAQTGNISCVGGNDGEITASTTGGTGAVTFVWSTGSTANPLTGLAAGTYTVTATDANGCTEVDSLTIADPAGIITTTSVINDASCNGFSDGSGEVSVTGGTAPYTYQWDDPALTTTDTVSNLAAGTYLVTVTDNNGCTALDSITIGEPSALTVTASGTDPQCAGDSTGSVSAAGNGGTIPYTFNWSSGQTGVTVNNLPAGTYTVTITDGNNCTSTDQVTLTDPAAITLSLTVTNALDCNGDSDGEITAGAGGGAGGFSFDWSTGATTNPITGLSAGTYTVTVTDANGCTAVDSVQLTEPTAIGLTLAETSPISCPGASDGEITASTTGGTGAVTFVWSTGSTANPLTGLSAGTYTVTATDANGCTEVDSLTLVDPAGLALTPIVINDVSCNGLSDGSGTVTVTGGTAPFTYQWDDPGNTTTDTVSNLSAGTYNVTVTDASGCSGVDSITITEPSLLAVTASGTDPLCAGDSTGSVSATDNGGGTPGYTFNWSSGQTGSSVNNLPAGTYTVTITDANNCTATDQVTLTDPAAITIGLTISNALDCFGDTDGEINAALGGGTGALTFVWSTGSTANPLTGLSAGTYTITVTDANNCTAVDSIQLTQPDSLELTVVESTAPSCGGGVCDAEATATTIGGTGIVTFSWNTNPVQTTATATGLCPDSTYIVTATDANGCISIDSITITNPITMTSTATILDSVECNGDSTGRITVAVTGGALPLSYLWSNGMTNDTVMNLPAGTYTVTVTDNSGCTTVASAQLVEPPALTLALSVLDSLDCNGDSTGIIGAVAGGGTGTIGFMWSTGATNDSIANLPAGTYTVTITDANGCTMVDSIQLTEPPAITITLAITDAIDCNGDSTGEITATTGGGTGTLTLNWSNGQTGSVINNLPAGTYTVTVTDDNGCTGLDSIQLTEPDSIMADIALISNSSCIVCDGQAGLSNITGGTGPYTFNWTSGETTDTASALCAGLNSVTITDNNGCTTVLGVVVGSVGADTVTAIDDVVSCFGSCDGMVVATYNCTSAPCTVEWVDLSTLLPIGTTDTIDNLCAGSYLVEVTNAGGCVSVDTAFVTEPTPVTVALSVTDSLDCNGDSDAELLAVPGGGTQPYTVLWSSGQNVANPSGLSAGTYTITVTDFNGCTAVDSIEVTEPPVITASFVNTVSSCTSCDGTSVVTPAGGDGGPYTFNWDNGQTIDSASALCPGAVNVTITDNSGCSEIFVTNIINITTDTIDSVTTTEPLCFGDSTGQAIAHYDCPTCTVEWFDQGGASIGTTDTITGIPAGNYSLELTNTSGCVDVELFVINEPLDLTLIGSSNDPSCANTGDGTASVVATGGDGNYTYLWMPMPGAGQGTANASGLSDGTWEVIVTDGNGCDDTLSFTLTDPAPIVAQLSSTASSCTVCDGEATVDNVIGGNGGPFTFLWSNGQTNDTATALCPGTVTVTITDNSGTCDTIMSILVGNSGADPVLALDDTVSCNGSCDGEAIAVYTCTDPPCTVNWVDLSTSNSVGTTDTVQGLCPGVYVVELTTNSGCTDFDTTIISQPDSVLPTITIATAIDCNGGSNGELTVNATGGDGSYSFEWSDGQTGSAASNLSSGTYTVTATDGNGCTGTASIFLPEPAAIIATTNSVPSSCTVCDGEASVSPSGGNGGPYSFLWNTGSTNDTISSLCAGTYTVTVTDNNNCTEIFTVPVSNIGADTLDSMAITNASCFNVCDGQAIAFYVCNDPPCTVNWVDLNTSLSIGTGDTVTGLCAGNYAFELTNNSTCLDITNFTITEPDSIEISLVTTNPLCPGDSTGTATATVTGGTAPYSYLWIPTPGAGQGTANATGLASGNYQLVVTDQNNCQETIGFTIIDPSPLNASFSGITGAGCTVCDGEATVTPTGGTGPYTFQWSGTGGNGQTGITLCGGVNFVTVTDANNCDSVFSVNIPVIGGDPVTALSFDASCNGTCDGEAIADYVCNDPPCTVAWIDQGTSNTVATTDTASNLCPGSYLVEVTNASGCVTSDLAVINEPPALDPAGTVTDVSCFGESDGIITMNVTGGDGNYTYVWSPMPPFGQGSGIVSGLSAGAWNVTVTDGNGCDTVATFNVNEPTEIVANETIDDLSCSNICEGTITLNPTGGAGGYTYNWSPTPTVGQGTAIADSLCAGDYIVTITDANGCFTVDTFTVAAPIAISLDSANVTNTTCGVSNGSIEVFASGGTGPLTYLWSPNPTLGQGTSLADSLGAGVYSIQITDSLGCQESFFIPVSDTGSPNISLSLNDVSCFGSCDGTAAATVSGGTAPYLITWIPGLQTTDSISGLCADQYGISVIDAAGCIASDTFSIEEPLPIQIDMVATAGSCNDPCSNSLEANVTNGTAPYSYMWSTGSTDSTSTNLCAGTYTVTVTDANGCTAVDSASVVTPTGMTLMSNVTDISCNGSCDGAISIIPVSGTAPYSFIWNTGDTVSNLSMLCAGTYTVTVSDAAGCVDSLSFDLLEPSEIVIAIDTTIAPDCGAANGGATVSATGGTPFTIGNAYLYQWLDVNQTPLGGQTSASIANVQAGIYYVEVSDSTGCSDTAVVIINDTSSAVIVNSIVSDMSCNGICDGSIDLTVSGTNGPPFLYIWSNGANTEDLTGLCAGSYTVQIIDTAGCSSFGLFTIDEPPVLEITSLISADETCGGECDGAALVVASGGTPGYTYNWSNGLATDTVTGLCAGDYTVTVTDASGCTVVDSTTIGGLPPIVVTIDNVTNTTCTNTNDGGIEITVSGGTPGYTILWVNGTDSLFTEDISNVTGGSYVLTIVDANNCTYTDTITIAATTPVTAVTMEDTSVCVGQDSMIITGSGLNGVNYQWTDTNGQILGTDSTLFVPVFLDSNYYILTVSNGLCFASDTLLVTRRSIVGGIDAGPDQILVDDRDASVFIGGNPTAPAGSSVTWVPTAGLDDPTAFNPSASPITNTTYLVTVVGPTGCVLVDSVSVEVRELLDIPSGFSPNGDGVNEGWVIDFIDEYPNAVVQIFNRWEQKIFESVGYNTPWDGTYEGNQLPVGTYYYVIDLKDPNVTEPITGPITIMR